MPINKPPPPSSLFFFLLCPALFRLLSWTFLPRLFPFLIKHKKTMKGRENRNTEQRNLKEIPNFRQYTD